MFQIPTAFGLLLIIASSGCHTSGQPFGSALRFPGQPQETDYDHPGMLQPSAANEKAPDVFRVKVATTKGDFVLECHRDWSPNGADRFYNLCKIGYMKEIAFFRAVEGFMFQFGIHGDPAVNDKWSEANIQDDPGVASVSNQKGFITFAKTGRPNSRSTQMFINLGDNSFLDDQGFTPFGKVVEGMEVIDKINTEYGENRGNVQGEFKLKGNDYIKQKFPNIDFIKSVTILDN